LCLRPSVIIFRRCVKDASGPRKGQKSTFGESVSRRTYFQPDLRTPGVTKEVRMPYRSLPSHPSLEHLKYQAKDLVNFHKAGTPEALLRIKTIHPKFVQKSAEEIRTGRFLLTDAQLVIAREYGFESWPRLKRHVESLARLAAPLNKPALRRYHALVQDVIAAYQEGDSEALGRISNQAGREVSQEKLRTQLYQAFGKPRVGNLSIPEARLFVSRIHGFENWKELEQQVAMLPSTAEITNKPLKFYLIDGRATCNAGQARDWDTLISLMGDNRVPGLDANGQMTDASLDRVSRLDFVTHLDLQSSNGLTDAGLQHLKRMPRLEYLDLSGWHMQITDRGLEVLRHLTRLKEFNLCWPQRVTDAGVANLKFCSHLERVNLLGTVAGDRTIAALAGKKKLRNFRTGNGVTDAGLALLHEFPAFKTWQGGDVSMDLLSFDAEPNYLLLRGSFTDAGLASLVGLDGLFALNLDDSKLAITPAGLEPLVNLPRLSWFAFDATNESMPYISTMPRLRFLMCQDTVASDEGFISLSRSQSIEYIWGRRCHNLRTRGFKALATTPRLRSLSVSCLNVDDNGLACLPDFPALKELMPMDVSDDGYRHIGRCTKLEDLVLMYCRETTDSATEHIAELPGLKRYFASYNKITDRSLEILGRMKSLESIELCSVAGVTNLGVGFLANLPGLRQLRLSELPNVTRDAVAVFPARVRVEYSV